MFRPLLALALVLALVGCGGGTGSSSNPGSQLSVTVWPQGKTGPSTTRTLGCPGGSGTLPAALSAYAKLSGLAPSVFAPVPIGTACTEIYGGPQIAEVTGTFAGKAINEAFSRDNGCEIARWQRLDFLFHFGPAPV